MLEYRCPQYFVATIVVMVLAFDCSVIQSANSWKSTQLIPLLTEAFTTIMDFLCFFIRYISIICYNLHLVCLCMSLV